MLDAKLRPGFNSPAGVRTLDWFVDLYKTGTVPKGAPNYVWDDLGNNFAAGKIALDMDWPGFASFYNDPKTSKLAGKVGVVRAPLGAGGKRPGWSGSHSFSITKVCDRPEDVYKGAHILAALTDSAVEVTDGGLLEKGSHIVVVGGSGKPDEASLKRVDVYLRFGDTPAPTGHPELATDAENVGYEARPSQGKYGDGRRGRGELARVGLALEFPDRLRRPWRTPLQHLRRPLRSGEKKSKKLDRAPDRVPAHLVAQAHCSDQRVLFVELDLQAGHVGVLPVGGALQRFDAHLLYIDFEPPD